MISRRDVLQVAAATAALGPIDWTRAFAQQRLTQDELLRFDPLGNVTLVHIADMHAQLVPLLFREPSVNLGVGEAKGLVPHVTGQAFLDLYKIAPGSRGGLRADLATISPRWRKSYGRLGGLDRIATILKAIRAERGERVVFLDGGDTWQNSYTSLVSKGQDMVDCMALLKPDAMVGHWEFTLGAERVKELVGQLEFPFLAQNVRDTEWNEPVFDAMTMIERGGVKIAVIGQALPYTPIANPRWMIPNWSFGIRENDMQANVEKARKDGAALVVLLSHNGFDVDRKLAARVSGIDVILTGAHPRRAARGGEGRQDAADRLRQPRQVRVAARSRRARRRGQRLPLQADPGVLRCHRARSRDGRQDSRRARAARSDAAAGRRPHRDAALPPRQLQRHVRRPDLRRAAGRARRRDRAVAGLPLGRVAAAGADITREDIYNATAITYPAAYRMTMTGARLKEVLEDVADNLFNPDPYYQQGGDMVRVGGAALHDRRRQADRQPHLRPDALAHRQAARSGQGLRRRRLGERERGHRRSADLGRRQQLHPEERRRRSAGDRPRARHRRVAPR